MSNWSATQLTDKGRALDAKVTAGMASLTFTKMKLGSGIETAADIPSMTDLTVPELVLGISSCAVSQSDDTICELIAIASSENVQTSFVVRELGVFATDPDDGEILYAVMLDSNPDTMPNHNVASPVTVTYQVNIMSSNASSISAVIDPAGLVSVSTLNAAINTHNTGIDAHADLLHLRKPSTAYAVGDIAYSALLPSWAYIECTVGGTTDSGDLPMPSSIVVNDTFTDGTVTWAVRKIENMANYTKTINSPMFNKRDIITTSGTYTAPVTGWYKITVKGGGGGGGGSRFVDDECLTGAGGGEGGTTIVYERMTAGDTATVTIGAGGAGGAAGFNKGSNGGNSSVVIGANTFTGGGGYGGGGVTGDAGAGGTGTIQGVSGGGSNRGSNSRRGGTGGGAGGSVSSNTQLAGTQGGGGGGASCPLEQRAGGAGGNGYVWFEYFDSTLNP